MSLGYLTPERAKEFGIEVTAQPSGPKAMRITLNIPITENMKAFSRVQLRMEDGDHSFLSANLKETYPSPDQVRVSFLADRDQLQRIKLWIIRNDIPLGGSGLILTLSEFVNLDQLDSPKSPSRRTPRPAPPAAPAPPATSASGAR